MVPHAVIIPVVIVHHDLRGLIVNRLESAAATQNAGQLGGNMFDQFFIVDKNRPVEHLQVWTQLFETIQNSLVHEYSLSQRNLGKGFS